MKSETITWGQLCQCRHSRSKHEKRKDTIGQEGKCSKCNCNKFDLIDNKDIKIKETNKVFIERASLLTKNGIMSMCCTDGEYKWYVRGIEDGRELEKENKK